MENGNWTGGDGSAQVDWESLCVDNVSPPLGLPQLSPTVVYRVPNGDLFGTSFMQSSWFGDIIELRDCGGATVYTIEEKIYKQSGEPDKDTCEKFKSCDGVVYLQYFIKNAQGKLVALTPYTTLFQESFDITDPGGVKIATVSRNGWDPPIKPATCEGAKPRVWNIKYASSPPGAWATVTNQWPIAAMMTMLSARDENRQPNGSVLWSNCEALKSSGYMVFAGILMCCCVCLPFALFLLCSGRIYAFLSDAESRLLPKRMNRPSGFH
jgi:hypothetical protein